jgi:four helix bundle suffix protein
VSKKIDGKNGNHVSNGKEPSSNSQSLILPPRGDYKTLLSYRKAEVIYQITYRFCNRFLKKTDRTIDQMVQASRSGKQNIIEGSKAATTSKEMEIKLTNVARASLEELLEDYRDYLLARDLRIWDKESREAAYARKLGMASPLSFEVFRKLIETRSDEVVANIAICMIHQANYLLDRQLKALEKAFLQDGGLRERMTRARLQAREQQRKGRERG